MITPVTVQLKGDREPQQHYALVFPDVTQPDDLILYRNAATSIVKQVIVTEELGDSLADECFWLLQFAEFISTSLDELLAKTHHEQP